jgi:hypothetical protein
VDFRMFAYIMNTMTLGNMRANGIHSLTVSCHHDSAMATPEKKGTPPRGGANEVGASARATVHLRGMIRDPSRQVTNKLVPRRKPTCQISRPGEGVYKASVYRVLEAD